MTNTRQMRAALALLDLTQQEVANITGIARSTLSYILMGKAEPATDTVKRLQNFFESYGVEFIDHDGVRMRSDDFVLKDKQGLQIFFDMVYESALKGSDIVLFNGVPSLLTKWAGKPFYKMHAERMLKISNRYDFRIVVNEDEERFIGHKFAHYRWVPNEIFNNHTIYVHGSYVGLFNFLKDSLRIRVMNNQEYADSNRAMFNVMWNHGAKEF